MNPGRFPVGIALGSNLGDRAAELEAGFAFLQTLASDGRINRSSLIETAPVDCPPGSPTFLNAVAEIQVDAMPSRPTRCWRACRRSRSRAVARETTPATPPVRSTSTSSITATASCKRPTLTIPHPRARRTPASSSGRWRTCGPA